MRFTLLFILISLVTFTGCGSTRSAVARVTAPAKGMALINVHYLHSRRTTYDFVMSDQFGKLTGALTQESVCQINVKPGKHLLIAGRDEVQTAIEVDAASDRIYDVMIDYDRDTVKNWIGWSLLDVKFTPVGATGDLRKAVQESEAKDRTSPIIVDRTAVAAVNPAQQAVMLELTQGNKKKLLQSMAADQYRR